MWSAEACIIQWQVAGGRWQVAGGRWHATPPRNIWRLAAVAAAISPPLEPLPLSSLDESSSPPQNLLMLRQWQWQVAVWQCGRVTVWQGNKVAVWQVTVTDWQWQSGRVSQCSFFLLGEKSAKGPNREELIGFVISIE
jgi:hypothetical protein